MQKAFLPFCSAGIAVHFENVCLIDDSYVVICGPSKTFLPLAICTSFILGTNLP